MFHPGVTSNDKLKVFSSEMCHSITFDYSNTIVHHGVDLLLFKGSPEIFEDPRYWILFILYRKFVFTNIVSRTKISLEILTIQCEFKN